MKRFPNKISFNIDDITLNYLEDLNKLFIQDTRANIIRMAIRVFYHNNFKS